MTNKTCAHCFNRGVQQAYKPYMFEPKNKSICYIIGKYFTKLKLKFK